jgi:chaperonin GroES
MKLRPLGDKMIVRREEAEEKTPGGILLPDSAKTKPQRGKVLAVGEGKLDDKGERIAMEVQPGDIVLFTVYGGNELSLEGEKYLILSQSDVLAILEK